MKSVVEEHAKRLQKVHEKAEKGTLESYLTKVDLLLYVDSKGLDRRDYGLRPETVGAKR